MHSTGSMEGRFTSGNSYSPAKRPQALDFMLIYRMVLTKDFCTL
jgi:hypothetical protein